MTATTTLETRRQKQARDSLIANMVPVLKAYLDKLNDEAITRARHQEEDNKAILQAGATQTARVDAPVTWKPELEARFAQLKLSVRRSKQHRPRPHHQPYPCPLRPLPWSRARSKGNHAAARHCTLGILHR